MGRQADLRRSRRDFARRYGALLGFLQRIGRLNPHGTTAHHVSKGNVELYLNDLKTRVSSVTAWNYIRHLRRAAELLAPGDDFQWLAEVDKDLAFVMQPRSKFDRLVYSQRLVEAGLTLMIEARDFACNFDRARGIRNGLLIALLALRSIRLKNFAALELGRTFSRIDESWWIELPRASTKTKRPDLRRVPNQLNPFI